MFFNISEDMKIVRELLNITQEELADELKVETLTIKRIENGITNTSKRTLDLFYDFIYKKKIYLNKIKEMFYKEELKKEILLFHGAKSAIIGNIDINKGRKNNDFGQGFYCGESYEQSASFVENFENSSVYYFSLDVTGLRCLKYTVDRDWMLTIAYFRGTLNEYKDSIVIKNLISRLEGVDYVVAPIADNKMFRIIDSFINGEITDQQCKHCLAATNLGFQYVLLNDNATSRLKTLECCYLSNEERNHYRKIKLEDNKISYDKVKLARVQYRGKGLYIDEILK